MSQRECVPVARLLIRLSDFLNTTTPVAYLVDQVSVAEWIRLPDAVDGVRVRFSGDVVFLMVLIQSGSEFKYSLTLTVFQYAQPHTYMGRVSRHVLTPPNLPVSPASPAFHRQVILLEIFIKLSKISMFSLV